MELLLAYALTCSDYYEMVERVNAKKDLSPNTKADIVSVYREYYREVEGMDCNWDANAD